MIEIPPSPPAYIYFTKQISEKSSNSFAVQPQINKCSFAVPNVFLKKSLLGMALNDSANSYDELRCTDEDLIKIKTIIHTLGTTGKISLLLNHKKRLEKLGEEIRPVHPLKFLGTIFSHPVLKKDMAVVMKDYFKRTNFLKDLCVCLNIEAQKGKIDPFLVGFANETKVPLEKIKPYADKKDWEAMVKFLTFYPTPKS